eukprot:6909718-Pyramimonas_sp.AAC.1
MPCAWIRALFATAPHAGCDNMIGKPRSPTSRKCRASLRNTPTMTTSMLREPQPRSYVPRP